MKISSKQDGKHITLAFAGELDHHAARGALKEIGQLVDTRLPRHCDIDMSQVDFMDSSGIAVVLGTYRRMSQIGGTMMVRNASTQARRVFSAAGINKLIEIV